MTNSKKKTNVSTLSLTRVRKLLDEAKFNPKKTGVMSITADAGNPSYFETRAIEFISEAQITRQEMLKFIKEKELVAAEGTTLKQYKRELISAIKMLTIAVLKVEDGEI